MKNIGEMTERLKRGSKNGAGSCDSERGGSCTGRGIKELEPIRERNPVTSKEILMVWKSKMKRKEEGRLRQGCGRACR